MLVGFAGRRLAIDEAVYHSERDTGHRNRAIAYLLRNAGILGEDVDDGARPLLPAVLGARHLRATSR